MRHDTVVVPFEHGMTPKPALPGPPITDHLSRAAARSHAQLHLGRVDMLADTGTSPSRPRQNAVSAPTVADRRRPGGCPGGVLAAARARDARATAGEDAGGPDTPFTRTTPPFTRTLLLCTWEIVPFTWTMLPFTWEIVPFTRTMLLFTRTMLPFTRTMLLFTWTMLLCTATTVLCTATMAVFRSLDGIARHCPHHDRNAAVRTTGGGQAILPVRTRRTGRIACPPP